MSSRSRIDHPVLLMACILFLCFSVFCQTGAPSSSALSALTAAKAQIAKGDLNLAEDSLWKVLSADPKNAEALYLLGSIRAEQKRYTEAESLFERSFEVKPDLTAAHVRLAELYVNEKKFADATRQYEQAAALAPANIKVKVALANLRAGAGDFASALQTLKTIPPAKLPTEAIPVKAACLLALGHQDEAVRLAQAQAGNPAVQLALAEVFLSSKMPDEALKSLALAARSGRQAPARYYFVKAKALDLKGHSALALANFEKALSLEPRSEEFLLATAELYSRQNRHAEAFALLARARDLDPDSLTVLRPFILEGVFAGKRDEIQQAAEELESKSTQPQDLYVVASILLENRRGDEAVPLLEKYLSQVPEDGRAWLGLGVAYQDTKSFDKAQKAFQRALEIDPNSAEAEFRLGTLASDQGNSSSAIAHLERALELNANNAKAWGKLGTLYLQAGQLERARDALLKSESLDPKDAETEYELAVTLAKLGDREHAKIHMERFQQLRPGTPKTGAKNN